MKTARRSKKALRMVHSGRLQSTRIMIIHFISVYCKDNLGRAFKLSPQWAAPACKAVENQIQALVTTSNLVRGVASAMWPPQGYLKH